MSLRLRTVLSARLFHWYAVVRQTRCFCILRAVFLSAFLKVWRCTTALFILCRLFQRQGRLISVVSRVSSRLTTTKPLLLSQNWPIVCQAVCMWLIQRRVGICIWLPCSHATSSTIVMISRLRFCINTTSRSMLCCPLLTRLHVRCISCRRARRRPVRP